MARLLRLSALPLLILGPALLSLANTMYFSVGFPPIETLAPDTSSFPSGWIALDPETDFPPLAPCSLGRPEVELLRRTYYDDAHPGAAAIHFVIQRYRTERAASEQFESAASVALRDAEWNTGWAVPDRFNFESLYADRDVYGCTTEYARTLCNHVSLYGVYVVELHAGFSPPSSFQFADLLPVYKDIDDRLAAVVDLR